MRLTINNVPDGTSYDGLADRLRTDTEEGAFARIDVGDRFTDIFGGGSGVVLTVTDDSGPERPPLKLWQVTGHVILTRLIDGEEWTRKRPIPVFYLDEQASGITDKEHAITIAGDIVLRSIVKLDSSVVLDLHVYPITYKLDRDQS